MTAVTDALSRFEVLDGAGISIVNKMSQIMEPTVLDNTAAPRYRFNMQGTPDDIPFGYPGMVDGRLNQVLQLSFKPTAAFTADTSDSTILLRGTRAIPQANGGWSYVPLELRLSDRITPDGANSTRSHPQGLADDLTIGALTWGAYLRFAPERNEIWILGDYQRADFHNSS